MKLVKVIANLDDEDQFEGINVFDDGYKTYGSEKRIVLVDPNGKVVEEAYKAGLRDPHYALLENGPQEGDPEPVNFTKADWKEWKKVMR